MAAGWATGLRHLEQALTNTSAGKRAAAVADLRIARAAHIHFATVANQARFVMARDALRNDKLPAEKRQNLRSQIVRLVDDEVELARKLFTLARQDCRIGFEASNHYYYVPLDMVEKVINCLFIRQQYAAKK